MNTDSTTNNSLYDILNKNTSAVTSKVYTNITDNTANAISNIRSFYDSSLNNNSLFIGLFVVIVIAIVIAYVLYTYIGASLFNKIRNVVDGTRIPVICTKLSKFEANINTTGNGSRRSYTFWIYINDMNTYKNLYKNVVAVSPTKDKFVPGDCSPHIFLDKTDNKLFVHFKDLKKSVDFKTDDTNMNIYMKTGIIIPYVPLQRWVHVTIVCNVNSFNSTIYTYIDGDMVKSYNDKAPMSEYTGTTKPTTPIIANYSNIDLNMSGFLYTGNTEGYDGAVGAGFSGLISKFTSFNYELNQTDIYNDYNAGPIDGILAKLGLGLYGIRNPIYKI